MRKRLAITALVTGLMLVIALATLPLWKPAAKRFKYFVVATNVYQDLLRRSGLRRDQISQPDYAALEQTEVPAYLQRINSTFTAYQRYGGLDTDRVRGTEWQATHGLASRFQFRHQVALHGPASKPRKDA